MPLRATATSGRYVVAVLRREVDAVAEAPEGQRSEHDWTMTSSGARPAPSQHTPAGGVLVGSSGARRRLLLFEDPPRGQGPGQRHDGEMLWPVLVVRGNLLTGEPLTVADGYHRIRASYELDEDADIPCRLFDLPR